MSVRRATHTGQPVFVVEDDATLREAVRWILEDDGLQVETAEDGGVAIEWLRHHRPSLVVLDMGLPVAGGDQVASALRETHGDRVPILLMTADGRAAEKARRVGAAAYVAKPFELDDLVERIVQLMQGSD